MLERKVAIITGAAGGIGREIVKRFVLDSRYNPIYAVDMNPCIHTIFKMAQYPQVISLQVDIRKGQEVAAMFTKVLEDPEGPYLVVNAAGTIIASDEIGEGVLRNNENPIVRQQLDDLWDTNYFGQMYIMQRAEIAMESRGGGTIINITSAKDYFPDPFRFAYMLSKQRFEEMSLDDARRLQDDGVRIIVVKPGNTKTNIDMGIWTDGINGDEAKTVQGFNDWWRRTFGNDPKNVADVIYKIAEGEVTERVVPVGLDAKLGHFLARRIPGWRVMFFLGAFSVYWSAIQFNNIRKRFDF